MTGAGSYQLRYAEICDIIFDIIDACVPSQDVRQSDSKKTMTMKSKVTRSLKLRTHARRVKTKINKAIHTVEDKDEHDLSTISSIGTMTAAKMARLTRSRGSCLLEEVLTKSVNQFIRKRVRADDGDETTSSSSPAKRSREGHEGHEAHEGPDSSPKKAGNVDSSHLEAVRKKKMVRFKQEEAQNEDDISVDVNQGTEMKTTCSKAIYSCIPTSDTKKRRVEACVSQYSCEPRNHQEERSNFERDLYRMWKMNRKTLYLLESSLESIKNQVNCDISQAVDIFPFQKNLSRRKGGKKTIKFSCGYCTWEFSRKTGLRKHLRKMHSTTFSAPDPSRPPLSTGQLDGPEAMEAEGSSVNAAQETATSTPNDGIAAENPVKGDCTDQAITSFYNDDDGSADLLLFIEQDERFEDSKADSIKGEDTKVRTEDVMKDTTMCSGLDFQLMASTGSQSYGLDMRSTANSRSSVSSSSSASTSSKADNSDRGQEDRGHSKQLKAEITSSGPNMVASSQSHSMEDSKQGTDSDSGYETGSTTEASDSEDSKLLLALKLGELELKANRRNESIKQYGGIHCWVG